MWDWLRDRNRTQPEGVPQPGPQGDPQAPQGAPPMQGGPQAPPGSGEPRMPSWGPGGATSSMTSLPNGGWQQSRSWQSPPIWPAWMTGSPYGGPTAQNPMQGTGRSGVSPGIMSQSTGGGGYGVRTQPMTTNPMQGTGRSGISPGIMSQSSGYGGSLGTLRSASWPPRW
jgi:hypothetical protein